MADRVRLILPALGLLSALAGCESYEDTHLNDQCMRADLFKQCMASLPVGPVATRYNDWDEVVKSCDSASYYQSRRRVEFVKPECRP